MRVSLIKPPLHLEGYYVTELSLKVRDVQEQPILHMQRGVGIQHGGIYTPDAITIDVRTGGTPHPEEPLRWQCVLEVSSNMPPERLYPYDFHVNLVGYFDVDEQVPLELREGYVRRSASSMLYSAARELLATATGRGPLPCVILPAVVFALDSGAREAEPAAKSTNDDKSTSRKAAKKATKKGGAKKTGGKKQQR
jgi:preprotein translocase subunit SecB